MVFILYENNYVIKQQKEYYIGIKEYIILKKKIKRCTQSIFVQKQNVQTAFRFLGILSYFLGPKIVEKNMKINYFNPFL